MKESCVGSTKVPLLPSIRSGAAPARIAMTGVPRATLRSPLGGCHDCLFFACSAYFCQNNACGAEGERNGCQGINLVTPVLPVPQAEPLVRQAGFARTARLRPPRYLPRPWRGRSAIPQAKPPHSSFGTDQAAPRRLQRSARPEHRYARRSDPAPPLPASR